MAFREYLHEKAEESRHSESVGYSISIIGAVFFIGGILETAIAVTKPEWFLVFPYSMEQTNPYSILGLGFTIIGFALLLLESYSAFTTHLKEAGTWIN